jgi:hypothetical protein
MIGRRLGKVLNTLPRAGVDQERQDVGSHWQRNPNAVVPAILEWLFANAAFSDGCGLPARQLEWFRRNKAAVEVRPGPQPGKRRPEFEIAIKSARAHDTVAQVLAARDFIRKPVQAVRGVGYELFQILPGRGASDRVPDT